QSAAAPRYLFPHQYAQAIACLEDDARLLVMSESDEIDAHLLHHVHFLPDHVFGHCRTDAGVVFMAMGTAEQQSLARGVKRPVLSKFEVPEADALGMGGGIVCGCQGQTDGI